MTKTYEFNLAFALPEGQEHDMDALSDRIWEAIPEDDPLVGLGDAGKIGVMLELSGESAEAVIADAGRRILQVLPQGSSLADIQPKLANMEEVQTQIVIDQAPLDRDEQIAFMKDAPKRRAASVERWSKSEMLQDALRKSAHRDTQDTQ